VLITTTTVSRQLRRTSAPARSLTLCAIAFALCGKIRSVADRFEQTAEDARAAIARAAARAATAHRRRMELAERIAALRTTAPAYSPEAAEPEVAAARERLQEAQRSCDRARVRRERALARHRLPES
jgi:hypothetical protein